MKNFSLYKMYFSEKYSPPFGRKMGKWFQYWHSTLFNSLVPLVTHGLVFATKGGIVLGICCSDFTLFTSLVLFLCQKGELFMLKHSTWKCNQMFWTKAHRLRKVVSIWVGVFTFRSGSTTGSSSMLATIFAQKVLIFSIHFGERRSHRISRTRWSSTWRK